MAFEGAAAVGVLAGEVAVALAHAGLAGDAVLLFFAGAADEREAEYEAEAEQERTSPRGLSMRASYAFALAIRTQCFCAGVPHKLWCLDSTDLHANQRAAHGR